MTNPVRFGLVGCGRIGALADDRAMTWPARLRELWLPYAHASSIVATPCAALAAVCDVSRDTAEAARARFGAEAAYSDHRNMLERARLDVLAVATRTAERPAIILDAIRAGVRGIYCEKPIATTLEEADEVVAAVEKYGVAFAYGTRRRFMAPYLHARRLVEEGTIGTLQSVVIKFGRGGLMWNHPHSVDAALFFAGDSAVEWVRADFDAPLDGEGPLVDCDPIVEVGQLHFANGVDAIVLPAIGQDVELCGTEGNLVIAQDGARCTLRRYAKEQGDIAWLLDEQEVLAPASDSGTARAFGELVDWVRSGAAPAEHARAALAGQEVLFGWVASHRSRGRRISMPTGRNGVRITGRVGEKFA